MMAQLKPDAVAAIKKARDQSKQENVAKTEKEAQLNDQKDENDELFVNEQTKWYMMTFKKSKDELMQEWLESDSNELVQTILELQKHNLQFVNPFYKSLEPLHQLMAHLDYFDAQIREKVKSKTPYSSSSNKLGISYKNIEQSSVYVEKMMKQTFGFSKQNQQNVWFEMTQQELINECKKYGLILKKNAGTLHAVREVYLNKLLHYMTMIERSFTQKDPREVKEKPKITNTALFRQQSQRNNEEKDNIEEQDIMDIVNQASSLKNQMQQKFDLKTMIRQNEQAKESDSDLDVIDENKVGPSTKLPRATIGFELPKHVSNSYYQHVPSLANSFNQIANNDPTPPKQQLLSLQNILQNPFNPEGYLSEFQNFKLGGYSSVDQFKALNTLNKTKKFLMKSNINYSFATILQKLKVSPTLPVLQETIRFTTENKHLINLHPDLSAKVEDLFHQLEKLAQYGKIPFHEFRQKSANDKSQFTFLEDIAHYVFKPENFNKFKFLQDLYLSKDCLKVPLVKDQNLDILKSLSSILQQLVNVPIPRDSVGRVVGDQSDIEKYQGVIQDVQQQFKIKGMLPIQNHLEEIPIVSRTNLMLLFPSADAQMSSEMTSQLTELLMSIIKHNFRDARAIGDLDITSQQLVYLAARVAQFYETNNDLVTFFRSKITDKIFTMQMNKQQLFTFLKTLANDKSLLFGEKGLNDIQFFAGGHPGCKYDPFLKENCRLNAKEMKDIVKIGSADIHLLYKIFNGSRRTLNATTVEDLDSILYVLDYVLIASPLFYEKLQVEQHVVRSYVNAAHLIADLYELPINIILRMGSMFNQRASTASQYAEELFQVQKKSETQHLKRDTDRDLLMRFNQSLLDRICNDQIYDHNRHSFGYLQRVGQPYSHQTFIIFNQQLKDLLDPEIKISPELEAIDNEIINQFLSSPIIAQRIFKDAKEAQSLLEQVFKRNLTQLTLDSEQELKNASFTEQEKILRLVAQRTEMINNMNIFTKDDKYLTELADRILLGNINQIGAIPSFNFDNDSLLPLEQLLKTNLAILQSCDMQNSSDFMKLYLEKFPMAQIIGQLMQNLFQDTSIDLKYFDFKSTTQFKLQVKRTIQETSWQTAQKYNSLLIGHFLYMLKFKNLVTANARVKQLWGMEDQAIAYLMKLKNCRTLHGKDLISLINLLSYVPQQDDLNFDKILLNITPVLGTLNLSLIPVDIGPRLFVEETILARKPQIIPTSLKFFADQLPETEAPPVIEQKSLLVPEFDQINEQMVEQHRLTEKKLFDLYKDMFERNNQLNLGQVNLCSLSWIFGNLFEQLSINDQIMCLQILGQHVENYSESFITQLYDKYSETDQLAKLNEESPTVFYKLASNWPQFLKNNAILDILTKIRETNQPVHEQYEALKVFTDKKILNPDLIEAHFTSLMRLTDRQQVKKYLQHLIRSMAYLGYTGSVNMAQLTQVFRRLYKTPDETEISQLLDFFVCMAISNPDLDDFEDKSRQFIEDSLNLIESMFTGTKSTTILRYQQNSENAMKFNYRPETPQISEDQQDVEKFNMYYFQSIPYSGSNFKKNLRQVQNKMDVQMMKTPAMEKYLSHVQQLSSDEDEENEDVDSKSPENQEKILPENVKIYERKATDTALSENLAYLELRKNAIRSMTKKGRHLIVYSNFNQVNHYDLNNNNTAKAWAVLFHFRSKSTESMLYEEFSAIAYRNSIAKTRSHEMFSQVYFRLLDHFSSIGVQLNLSRNCQQTGWPMDIHLVQNPAYKFKYKKNNQGQEPPLQNFALYFLLKEELCFNTKYFNRMEPLGLQKLMQKHLSTFGTCKVIFVNEDDVLKDFEGTIEKVKQSFDSDIRLTPQKQTQFEDMSIINTTEQMLS